MYDNYDKFILESSLTNLIDKNNEIANTDITKIEPTIESHPFGPVLPSNATIMMMGTFPPTSDKWGMTFHYPNFYNDMWRIYGRVFFDNGDYFRDGNNKAFDPDRIQAFMQERGIASCPTVKKAIREQGNAADKHLMIVEAVDLEQILDKVPHVHSLFTTGGKATEILMDLLAKEQGKPIPKSKIPKTNQHIDYNYAGRELTLYRLPSTSRAYPLSLDKKVEAYRNFFKTVGKI
ncbi:DNA glycosylase [Psychrobacter sp.]|uniref:DNA glycosylase n=1 Tax=Psychrobacter sp. TaxID=56811 RepID=UPI0025F4C60F|nr:DNA glycosylase [Psychrobacter sp.]